MPTLPNFVFTDPVAASQLVGLAQIAQAEDAARKQAMLGTLQALGQQDVARQNAAAERSRYQSQADLAREQIRAQSGEAAANRAARSSEVDRTIAANRDIAKMETDARVGANTRARQDASDIEEYNFVLSRVESEDPPTDDEFRALSLNLAPERASRLDGIRRQNVSALNQAADNAEAFANYWNSRINKIGSAKTGETLDTIIAEATKSQAGKFIIFDPQARLFRSVIRRPRASLATAPAGSAAPPGVEDIQSLLRRTAAAAPSAAAPLPAAPPNYMNMGGMWSFPPSSPASPMVPTVPWAPSAAPMPATIPGLTPGEIDYWGRQGAPIGTIPPFR